MATNTIPTDTGEFVDLATNMLSGLSALGETLGITQIAPTTFAFTLDNFTGCRASFSSARTVVQVASTAWVAATEAVGDWLVVARSILAGRFGNRWSAAWVQAGFIDHSTAVPRRVGQRLSLAQSLATFFSANPSYQVTDLLVTAARATALRNAALTAQGTREVAEVAARDRGVECETARAELTAMMRSLIGILKSTLARDDARWVQFGLNVPGSDSTPGVPVNLTVGTDYAGSIVGLCEALPLARRYRWRMRIAGVEPEFRLVATTTVPVAQIAPVTPGVTLEFIVQGVNGGSQGVACAPVLFTMPALAGVVAEEAPRAARKVAPARYGHAEGNGNGNGHPARVA